MLNKDLPNALPTKEGSIIFVRHNTQLEVWEAKYNEEGKFDRYVFVQKVDDKKRRPASRKPSGVKSSKVIPQVKKDAKKHKDLIKLLNEEKTK